MAFYDTTWYCNYGNGTSTGYYAVTVRPQNTAVAAGVIRRQFTAPAVGSERCFVCIVAGTTANVTDATWVLTRGAKTTDGTATWQECTGASAVNGDLTNTATWTQAKAIGAPTLGAIIQRNNGASYWICSTAGTMGASEPAWPNNTAGTTQADGTTTWTCLGVVGNFSGGGAPHARLANACTSAWMAVGNAVYVGDNHAESQGSNLTIGPAGNTAGLISKILCHNHLGSYPPTSSDLTTGATISTAGTGFTIAVNAGGSLYVYGITFKAMVGGGSSANPAITLLCSGTLQFQFWLYFDNCSFQVGATSTVGSYIQVGSFSASTQNVVIWNNCTVSFGASQQYVLPGTAVFLWRNTGQVLAGGSVVPSTLLISASNNVQNVTLEALDLSQITGTLAATSGSTTYPSGNFTIKDCKLNAGATIQSPIHTGMTVQLVRSDSGATAYKSARYAYEGTETTETSITRVGGAVDASGQAQSRKIVTTANAQWLRPFKAEPYAIWNPVTAANVTVTLYGTINSGTLPNNDELFMEVEFLGDSASPLGTLLTTTKASLLETNAAVSSDASTWNGGGSGGGWSPFKLTATLSSPQPGMAGYLYARVRAAKPSTTYYIDPKILLT